MRGGGRSSVWSAAYGVLFSCYLAGLLIWLLLGLLPPLMSAVPALRHALDTLAAGGGPLAGPAGRILGHRSSFRHGIWVAIEYLFSAFNLALGVLLAVRRPHDAVPRLLSFAFIGTAATFNAPSHEVFHILGRAPLITAVHFTFHVTSGVAYLWAVLLFPDGRAPVRGFAGPRRILAAVAITAAITVICWRSSFIAHPPFFVAFFGILVPVVGMAAQSLRLRSTAGTAASRQQSRVLRLALAPALAAALVWLAGQAARSSYAPAGHLVTGVENAFPAVFAVVPLVLFVAILRYRLWDIDLVISRALVVALVGGFTAVVYIAAVGSTGWLLSSRGWSAVVAMTIVGLLVEPVRQQARAVANSLVFGQQLTPREALRGLAERLEHPSAADDLSELTAVIVSGTRCSRAEIWLVGADSLLLAAAAPAASGPRRRPLPPADGDADAMAAARTALGPARCVAVTHEGRLLAVLALTLPPGVVLPPAEVRLIDDLAGHAGLLVANAELTRDLARQVEVVTEQAADLARSRQQVVAAQDAERRRLERDIHDGAQQELVAMLLQLRAAGRSGHALPPEQKAALRDALVVTTDTLPAIRRPSSSNPDWARRCTWRPRQRAGPGSRSR